jgi:hypothetical protein
MNTQIERNKSQDHFHITGNWALVSRKLQDEFPTLEDEDVRLEPGNEEDLLTRLGIRLRKERHELIHLIATIQVTPRINESRNR